MPTNTIHIYGFDLVNGEKTEHIQCSIYTNDERFEAVKKNLETKHKHEIMLHYKIIPPHKLKAYATNNDHTDNVLDCSQPVVYHKLPKA